MKKNVIFSLIVVIAAIALQAAESEPLSFTSLRPEGTNLVVEAAIPANVSSVILEARYNLGEGWTPMGKIEISETPAHVLFTVPRPAQMQFLRLTAVANNPAAKAVSDLTYVTVPSLTAQKSTTQLQPEATFHFRGKVDGSDEIIITHKGAFWKHREWNWPDRAVSVNGVNWEPRQSSFLTTSNGADFIAPQIDFETARLETVNARDVVALERTNDALIVHIDDTPSGPGDYDFVIHFTPAQASSSYSSAKTVVKISAIIDGSDTVTFDGQKAEWRHGQWHPATNVKLNTQPWDITSHPVLRNGTQSFFLPPNIDFRSARLIKRSGRDLVSLWTTGTNLTMTFADNPNGATRYEAEIEFDRVQQ